MNKGEEGAFRSGVTCHLPALDTSRHVPLPKASSAQGILDGQRPHRAGRSPSSLAVVVVAVGYSGLRWGSRTWYCKGHQACEVRCGVLKVKLAAMSFASEEGGWHLRCPEQGGRAARVQADVRARAANVNLRTH